jgi:hypothetical protein
MSKQEDKSDFTHATELLQDCQRIASTDIAEKM